MANFVPVRSVEVLREMRARIEGALKELLESKHLYQSVTLKTDDLLVPLQSGYHDCVDYDKGLGARYMSRNVFGSECQHPVQMASSVIGAKWTLCVEKPAGVEQRPDIPITNRNEPICFIPRILRPCAKCESPTAHLPSYFESAVSEPLISLDLPQYGSGKRVQLWVFAYQCQVCRGEPNLFLVRRYGVKLTLVGRSIFERVEVPKFVPEVARRLYSEAIIASQTGNYLPGCLYLRLVIEHYIKSVVNPSELPERPTGDDLADQYIKVLHPEFPRALPSFRSIYSDLSEVIHAGDENPDVFTKCLASITTHFDQLRILPVTDWREIKCPANTVAAPAETARKPKKRLPKQ